MYERSAVDIEGWRGLHVESFDVGDLLLQQRIELRLGGTAKLRLRDGHPLVTDNGQHILDVTGLQITDPLGFESRVNQWPGVVTVGVFAHQKAGVCLLGTASGVKTLKYD